MKKSINPLPDIAELRAITVICREGSITRSARVLGTTQSTLSYLVERMRKRFSDPLFIRIGNKMEATPYAQELASTAERILTWMETEFDQLKQFNPETTTREFRIVLSEIGAIVILPSLLRQFQLRAPNAKLVPMQPGARDIEHAMASGEIDIAIGNYAGLENHLHLYQQLLFQRQYVCIVRKDHPEIGDTLSLSQFANAAQVKPAVSSDAFRELTSHLSHHSLQMNVTMTVEHPLALPFIVGSSNMIALIAQEVYELFAPVAHIRVVRLPLDMPSAHVRQYWHPRVNRDPAVTFLRNVIHDSIL